ncbi:HAD family hydrolase [Paenibacillus sp. FSL R5-0407]|uniref:HAD family hydrolase n=1 Tax=Paenibacillus sp. FSL R5-0407 TaxID=2975320 RepID=UPI0030FAA5B9
MAFKAVFLDFYGTLVHEDEEIIPLICDEIRASSSVSCENGQIGGYWWQRFSSVFRQSYGDSFLPQREIGIRSLTDTINNFQANGVAEQLIQKQFDHWIKPEIYEDTIPFLQFLQETPVYILSNIDTEDIKEAIAYHELRVTGVITSEDVRAYKPRPELFEEGLRRSGLSAKDVIHIGDSLSSDVEGARKLGIATVWLNRLNKRIPENIIPDFICKDLNEVRNRVFQESSPPY